jgi:hypothetical protein
MKHRDRRVQKDVDQNDASAEACNMIGTDSRTSAADRKSATCIPITHSTMSLRVATASEQ